MNEYKITKKIPRFTKLQINELVQILKNDGVISVPTDTVYGVCSRINSIKAYNNLIKVKNRPASKPFPVMCSDIDQIKTIAIINPKVENIINEFMPGPITLVLPKKDTVENYITNGLPTIAVRMATSESLRKLIEALGCPIFMSSANQSGEPTCTNLDEIEKSCPLLDGMMEGDVSFGKGSTIVDCSNVNYTNIENNFVNNIVNGKDYKEKEAEFKILREGPISLEDLMKIFK